MEYGSSSRSSMVLVGSWWVQSTESSSSAQRVYGSPELERFGGATSGDGFSHWLRDEVYQVAHPDASASPTLGTSDSQNSSN